MFGIFFRDRPPQSFAQVMQSDREAFNRFFHAMLERGVYLAPSAFEAGFVSARTAKRRLRRRSRPPARPSPSFAHREAPDPARPPSGSSASASPSPA